MNLTNNFLIFSAVVLFITAFILAEVKDSIDRREERRRNAEKLHAPWKAHLPNGTLVMFSYPYEEKSIGIVLGSEEVPSSINPQITLVEYEILRSDGMKFLVYGSRVWEVE